MSIERTSDGWQLRLRSTGAGRYFGAGFLAFWLCGWAAGEAFALWFLGHGVAALLAGRGLNSGDAPIALGVALLIGLFLLFWLTLWTIGGFAAASELMRLLWGEDRVTITSGRLTAIWQRGWFRRTRTFERDAIRSVSLSGRNDRLTLETARERVELSSLGSRDERAEAVSALKMELGTSTEVPVEAVQIPKEWEQEITPEGERVLVPNSATRRVQARVAGVATLALGAVMFVVASQSRDRMDLLIPAIILLVFVLALAGGTVWLAQGRNEWRIGNGRLTLRRRFRGQVRDLFEARRLMLERTSDSDGDPWFELIALADAEAPPVAVIRVRSSVTKKRRTIARVMDDGAGVSALGTWLARETGMPLDDRSTPQAIKIELAELRVQLEQSGRFGQWAAKAVDWLAERQKRK